MTSAKQSDSSDDSDDDSDRPPKRRERKKKGASPKLRQRSPLPQQHQQKLPVRERLGSKVKSIPIDEKIRGWNQATLTTWKADDDAEVESVRDLRDDRDDSAGISVLNRADAAVLGMPDSELDPVRHELGTERVPMFPSIDEMDPDGYIIQHRKGGSVCGGTANMEHYKFVEKIASKYKFDYVPSGQDEIFYFKRTVRNFIETVKASITMDVTMYTIVAVFMSKTQKFYHVLKEMTTIQETFTSFRAFINEFIVRQWPNVKSHALMMARTHKQLPGQTIEAYYEAHIDVHEETGRPIDDSVEAFIDGILSPVLRKYVRMHDYGPDRSLLSVRNYASRTVQNIAMEGERSFANQSQRQSTKKTGRGRGFNRQSIATLNRNSSAGRGRGAKHPSTSRGRGVQAGAAARRGNPGNPTTSRGRIGGRGGTTRGRGTAGPSRPGARGKGIASFNHSTSLNEAAKAANAAGLRGCLGCLRTSHLYEDFFKFCPDTCVFCKKVFTRNDSRHFAPLCRKMPKDKAERMKILREAGKSK